MKKFSLLYVDDEPSNLRIFKDTFRRDYDVFLASSAKEGIEILHKNPIDLVLSDQRMPEMTGVEFLQYTLNSFPDLNRILITGYSDIGAIESAVNKAHIFQYIKKPWSRIDLQKVIDSALYVYKLERDNKQQFEELVEARAKAMESEKLKTEFFNNISHEIRTPLNGILGFSHIICSMVKDNEELVEYTDVIERNSDQLVKIIDDILELSSLGLDDVQVHHDYVPLNAFFEKLHSKFKNFKKNINLILHLEKDELFNFYTDMYKLESIISNLLTNAFKYTESGSVEFGYRLVENSLKIYVKDTGIGIAPENHEMVFLRFSQESKDITEKKGGLGLGLSIVKENVSLLGGEIELISEKNKGAEFIISIPDKIELPVNNDVKVDVKIKDGDKTILVVEDEETNFLFIEAVIHEFFKEDVNVVLVKNGLEAVELVSENQNIDLIFMDLKMPLMDGFEATRKIKSINANIPIVAQTAYTGEREYNYAKEVGCDEFLTKPLKPEMVKNIIEKYIQKSSV